jgi:hypothetical protein
MHNVAVRRHGKAEPSNDWPGRATRRSSTTSAEGPAGALPHMIRLRAPGAASTEVVYDGAVRNLTISARITRWALAPRLRACQARGVSDASPLCAP